MDGLTKLLLQRHAPNDPRLEESPDALTAVAKSTGMTVVMSANDYSDSVIFAAVTKFNREHPEYMSYSFTLPIATNGIAAGSWVLTDITEV
ncbi:hypothetical protein C1X89_26950 [Pseudomonas sp. GP01-A8]|nr:hypothetical protein C1X90_27445 [Pseudomonas sp. GP01-A9]PMU23508.1 hypothetical protein C1X88_27105 [Pseudomonas sp. GP01-A13]PMU33717.1 hypothetical protein C1X89_26950 [Pseudomonas sp. GP01-A8]PMU48620.1 hypothetical protein C1X85_29625 [Pseudomonas sp. GP01-A6]PMU48829.1 hypothetical protein C1X87_18970 [Pseudomonas sp. GP01-A14]PMU59735.1 hypothetical protein C1X86_27175 [Pseudomonas sp. GP01-A3]PMU68183.1 hypothetical protein C1X84_28580 [Pseudomonas sp. GP01-A1]PMU70557.1 hypothet